ncbi:MAG: 4Fe-4S dicluster domain-containing protein [Oligoflexales bacterium]
MREVLSIFRKYLNSFKNQDTGDSPSRLANSGNKKKNRRNFIKGISASAGVGASIVGTGAHAFISKEDKERLGLSWEEYFRSNYRYMTKKEKKNTVQRLERLAKLKRNETVSISNKEAIPGVLYGYAFNISKCQGYMDCIDACLKENNLDRKINMQYIKMFEIENGSLSVENGDSHYFHEVPKDEHFYMGTQCMQCENPPCVSVCPTEATWKEEDGIVVVDYDWCIGCRYCEAACPYEARRFNWAEPQVPSPDLTKKQHYLGNRRKTKGVMEKCTFCIQRTREGDNPACVDACPTGARVFGNLLDPNSEIRKIIETKKVFRLKEELGTEPKFWYYMD